MKTRMIVWLMVSFLGLLAFRPPEAQKSKSYQGWIKWISGTTNRDTTHVATPEELADIVSAISKGQIVADTTYILSSGMSFKMAHPKEYFQYVVMCVKDGEPSIVTTEDVINAIQNGEVVKWGNDISCKVKNYYYSLKYNEVRFNGDYSGAEQGIPVLLINGKPKIKMDCLNPLQPYGNDYTPNYTKGVPVPDTVYITVDENGKTKRDTVWVVLLLEEEECPPLCRTTYCNQQCYDCSPSYSYDYCQPSLSFSFNFSFGAPNYCGGYGGYGSYGGYYGCNRYYNSGGTYIDNSTTYIDNSSTYIDNSYYNYEDNDVVNNYYPRTKQPNDDGQGIDPKPTPDPSDDDFGFDPKDGGDLKRKGGELTQNQIPSSSSKATTVATEKKINGRVAPYTKPASVQTTGKDLVKESNQKPSTSAVSNAKVIPQQKEGNLTHESTKPVNSGGELAKMDTRAIVSSVKTNSKDGSASRQEIVSSQKQVKPGSELTRVAPTNKTGGELTRATPANGTATRQVATAQSTVKNPSSKVVQPVASARPTSEGGSATRKIYAMPSSKPPTSTQSSRSTQPSQQGSNQSYSAPANSREGSHSSPSKKASSVEQSRQKPSYSQPSRSYSKPQQTAGRNNYYSGQSGSSGGGKTRSGGSPNSGYSGGGKSRSPGNSGGGGASRSGGHSSSGGKSFNGGGNKPR